MKIVRNIERADAGAIAKLGEFGAATVHEAQGRTGLMHFSMRPVWRGARVAGSAVTVWCPTGDNLMIHAAIEVCRAGDVLVVATDGIFGMFGDLLAASCQARGIAGLVIDSGVRDLAELEAMKFPVWSRAIFAQGTVKATAGSVNAPIVCAGAAVEPGDVIVADSDGIVLVKRCEAVATVIASELRTIKEAETRARLKAGELGLDIYGLRAKLAELGVEYED